MTALRHHLAVAGVIAAKDLRAELRGRQAVTSTLFLAAVTMLVFGFALGPDRDRLAAAGPGLLWLAVVLSGMAALGRLHHLETEDGAFELLGLYPISRTGIYLGKAIGGLAAMLALGAIVLPLTVILFAVDLAAAGPALLLVLVLERPTALRVVLLLVLLGVAYSTRVQAVALAPAALLAPFLLLLLRGGSVRETVSRFRWLYGLVAGLALAAVIGLLASGRGPRDLLGAYSPVGDREYDVAEALRYAWWHLAELSLYVLVVPLAATIVLVGRARSLDERLQSLVENHHPLARARRR